MGDGVASEVERLWADGEEVRGWARYWNSLYRFLARQRASDPVLGEATLLVRYEDLCERPRETLAAGAGTRDRTSASAPRPNRRNRSSS